MSNDSDKKNLPQVRPNKDIALVSKQLATVNKALTTINRQKFIIQKEFRCHFHRHISSLFPPDTNIPLSAHFYCLYN